MRRTLLSLVVLILSLPSFAATMTAASSGVQPSDPEQVSVERAGRAVILRAVRPLSAADRDELAAKGIRVQQVLTGGRLLARVADGAEVTDPRLASVEPLTAEKKVHVSALRAAARGRSQSALNVFFLEDVSFESARAAVLAAGGSLRDPLELGFSPLRRLEVSIPSHAVMALASDDRVLTVTGVRNWRVRSDNATTAALSHVTELYEAPYGLTGEGVTVSLFELARGLDTHPEFGGRLTVHAEGGTTDDKKHATHVAGTIGAAGLNPVAKGMAPRVKIHQFCVASGGNDCDNDWLEDKESQLSPLGVVADNNSWGYVLGWTVDEFIPLWNDYEEYFGAYDLMIGAPLDQISNEQHILFVHSAGNDGEVQTFATGPFSQHRHVDDEGEPIRDKTFCYSVNGSGTDCPVDCTGACETVHHDPKTPFDTIGVTAGAKNIITVGNVRVTGTGGVEINPSSSRGPAKDGRIKPEVVARGTQVRSTALNNDYASLNGTSMSAPAVTGIAALLTEQWRKTFNGADPIPAQLKALIIAGAEDLGNPGPDYTYGFGMINAKRSVDAIIADGGTGARIRSFTVAQGETKEVPVVLTEAQNLRLVLNWPDPHIVYLGGDDIAEKALVNDLDIRVIDPAGTVHLPWVLDKDAFNANATRGVNTVDSVEMIEIPNAVPGRYRVIIAGTSVAEGPQDAVLVSSGLIGSATPPCRDAQEASAGSNDTPQSAYGNLVSGQTVFAGLCADGDVDYYRFVATKSGAVTVEVSAGATPVKATLTISDFASVVSVPANGTRTISVMTGPVPASLLLRIEAEGARAEDLQYSFVPRFGETNLPRRRSVRR